MKAVRLIQPGRPLEMQEIPTPAIGPADVLVRVEAAGICRSDMHYRAGVSPVAPLPMTLGHEVAGVVEQAGESVERFSAGDRVCLHYMVTCGQCEYCVRGSEQFCTSGQMLGKNRDGGYAEYIALPARGVFRLPDEIPFEQGAIAMCSSATSFHALRKAEIAAGERIAIFGVGGLGMSAVQLAQAFGALDVFAVDIDEAKLEMARGFGAIPINGRQVDAVAEIRRQTAGKGVDVALELIGLPATIRQAVDAVGVFGRVVVVGLSEQVVGIDPYRDLIGKEAKLIGCSDHLAGEIPLLLELIRRGKLDLSHVVTRRAPLDAAAINDTLDRLERFSAGDVRTVILPNA
jgi:2-desacetyl-2-hydroxyethyl bacteriochlorophyllide A dehydrogenase